MLKKLFSHFKWQLVIATILSAISAGLSLFMMSIIAQVVGEMGADDYVPAYSFLTFTGVLVVVIAFGVMSQWIMLKMSTSVVYKVQKIILERILGTSYQTIEKHGNHKIMAAMKDDVGAIAGGITMLPGFTFSAVTVILCLGYMIYTAWQLFLLVVLVIGAILILTEVAMAYSLKKQEALREDYDAFFSNLNALANGGKDLHVNQNRKRHFYGRIMVPLFKSMRDKTIKASAAFIGLESSVNSLILFLVGSIIFMSLAFFPDFDRTVVVTFTIAIMYMVEPLTSVLEVGDEINGIRVSLKKITSLELVEPEEFLASKDKILKSHDNWDEIRLKDATFTHDSKEEYDNYQFKLGPISADFKAGEVTFITGGNGSGKSTIAKLLAGLYKLDSGDFYAGQHKVGVDSELSLEDFQNSISVIFADSYVFPEILNDQGVTAEDIIIREHIERLRLTERIDAKDGKVTSTKLSTGQSKRLALLQSFMLDAHVCIYDEWAADQDPTFKEFFYNTILPELKNQGKIIIVISHDSQYFDTADKLLSLEDGNVISMKQLT